MVRAVLAILVWLPLCLTLSAVVAAAEPDSIAEPSQIVWMADVTKAWEISQQWKQPLLLFISSENCLYCDKMKEETYGDVKVAADINESFVAASIMGKDWQVLVKKLSVKHYPATVIISPHNKVLDRIEGFVAPTELRTRLATAQQLYVAARDKPPNATEEIPSIEC